MTSGRPGRDRADGARRRPRSGRHGGGRGKGDADLSNDEYVEDSWALLADNGSHPFFYFEGDWCADIVVPLLGD